MTASRSTEASQFFCLRAHIAARASVTSGAPESTGHCKQYCSLWLHEPERRAAVGTSLAMRDTATRSKHTRLNADEVFMFGRRSHPRFAVVSPWEGSVRVLRAVVVNRSSEGELLAVSHAPGIIGEEMSLDLFGSGSSLTFKVRVLDSSPVILAGALRHRIRLELVPAQDAETAPLTEMPSADDAGMV